ncbi:tetratricopeptide repeat protein [Hyalangium minutum]|uniref:Finger-like domain/tetratricopeptide repeat protein n=1 Tax=Hyalangium minutum TaxID=394096 RepID=A0A085W848_9BACT|nr:tetratricopeptide repeat protein [Hyalangium minutum]KFE63861.1 finger-like domain/tetratricopeptide repeat protein [Hyalangium minutum]
MKVSCPTCQTNYNIDDKRIPPGGAKLKCAKCQNTFPIRPPSEGMPTPVAIPLPGAAATPSSAAIPLPGAAAPQSAAIPLPGTAAPQSAAIPLPGAAAPQSAAIPLPGAAAPQSAAIPLPGAAAPAAEPFGAPPSGGSDYSWDENESTRVVALSSLPQAAFRDPPPAQQPPAPDYSTQEVPGTARDFDFSNEQSADPFGQAPDAGGQADPFGSYDPNAAAIPLPGTAAPQQDYALPQAQDAFALDGPAGDPNDPFALPPPPASPDAQSDYQLSAPPQEDPFALPPPPSGAEQDPFALPPPPSGAEQDLFALPPPGDPQMDAAPPSSTAFTLPEAQDPSLEMAPPHAFAFPPPSEPAPSEPDPFAVDLSDPLPPPPEPDLGLDFNAPPAPAAAAAPAPASAPVNIGTDFGDIGFGDPLPPAGPPAADSLEFDPTAPSGPAPGDDLEVDLSAPLPPPPAAGTTDGLEMLSFIDDAAKDSTAKAGAKAKRFHVRRRSGKVFGPFEEGVIVKMLEEGQLLGNEDVSTDSDNWTPIGTVASFAAAIQKLMEGPASKTGLPAVAPSGEPAKAEQAAPAASPAANLDRVAQLYEGRMANIAVVDRSGAYEKWRKRMPMLIGSGAALLVLMIGGSFGFTKYGVFGHRKLFPPTVKEGSPAAAEVAKARTALTQDTFVSYREARDLTARVLATKEYPEVRATWCQAIYYLQRRYAAADTKDFSRCQESREALELLGIKNVEVVKAFAGYALTRRQADEMLETLKDAYSREANAQDLELAFLLAETQALKRQDKEATATLNKILQIDKNSAKAQHMLGNLHRDAGRAEEAVKAYEAALLADPAHVISAVELAAVELLLVKGDPAKGLEAVEKALDEKALATLGPAEIARAKSLKGVALAGQFKFKEAEAELKDAMEKDPSSSFIKAQLARALRANRDYARALPLYEALAKEDPSTIEYTEGYISSLLTLGKMADAVKAVKAANERFTNDARIALLFARIDDARDQTTDAEGHYQRALKADPKLFEANLYLGRFYLRLRRNAEARAQLEQAAQKAPEDAGVRAGMGELALTENKLDVAQQEFEKSAQLNPSLAEAYLGLSRVALLNGELEKANQNSSKALELDPYLLKDGRLQRGTVLWRLGKLDDAVAELEKAKEEDPRSVSIPITLGAVLYEKADYPNAEKNLSLALTREPSNHEALYYLARVKTKRSEYSGAIEQMKLAVDKAPSRPDYHYALGEIYKKDERFAEAIEEWKKTLELDPKNADAYEALGHVYLETGKIEDAIKSLEQALVVDPKRKRVLGGIGDAIFSAGRWDEAIRRYEKALKEAPELTYVFYKIGRCWSEKEQHGKAIDWYKKAIAAEPKNPDAYYYLGFSYKDRFKKKDAAAAFRKYLELKPTAEDKNEIEDEIAALE